LTDSRVRDAVAGSKKRGKTGGFGGVRLKFKANQGKPGAMTKPMKKSEMRKAVLSDRRRPGLKKKAR